MKIALSFPGCNRRGGVERIIYECARYLAGRGDEVTVFANDFEKNDARVAYKHVPVRSSFSFMRPVSYFRECSRLLDRAQYDALGTFGCVCPEGGVYWAQSVHAAWMAEAKKFRAPLSLGRLKQRLNPIHPVLLKLEERHLRARAYRKVIALTEQVRSDLQQYYGVPPEDVVVLPNGFAPAEFNVANRSACRAEIRPALGYDDRDRVVVFVANELERKGFAPLLRAIAQLRQPDLRLLAVGRLNPDTYKAEIAQLGLEDRVRFTGPTSDVAKYYCAADVFALPTQYEAWGMVIVEAMASGLPVLTSRLAGAAVAVREPATGRLLDDPRSVDEIASKLAPLLAGDHASSEAIAESVQSYAWPGILASYERILKWQMNGNVNPALQSAK